MEKLELKKRLEKKKAYLACLVIFLILAAPNLLGIFRQLNVPQTLQLSVFGGILVLIAVIYKKMNRVRAKIKSLGQVKVYGDRLRFRE
jgi:hypothetical protein